MPSIRNRPEYVAAREFKALNQLKFARAFGAHSWGIGRKIVGGQPTEEVAIRFYVAKKQPDSVLSARQRIPKVVDFYSYKLGRQFQIKTDVIESPMARTEQFDPEARHRPVPGGVSCGIVGHTGTLGGFAWDETDDSIVMLSNDHVFGHNAGTAIIQQGSADGGALPGDRIGEVKRGIARSAVADNTVDAAIGDPDDADDIELEVHDIGPAIYAIEEVADDLLVEKYGQTTEHTFGEVSDVDWSGTIDDNGTNLDFEDCFRIDAHAPSADWSNGGDSGSLVFSQTAEDGSTIKPVVGLHFAGGDTYGIACKIQNVFDDLDLTTLCAGAFAALIESLFGDESESEGEAETSRRLGLAALATRQPLARTHLPFLARDRRRLAARRPHAGLARDMEKRLAGTARGKQVVDFVRRNRATLLNLLVHDGDVRRATVAALRPLLADATVTDDLLTKTMGAADVQRFERLAELVAARGGPDLKRRVDVVRPFIGLVRDKALKDVL